MDRKTKIWLIALGIACYALWTASLFTTAGPLRSVMGAALMLAVAAMGLLLIVGITSATQRQWDRLRAEGTPVTAIIKGYHKARVMFEIRLPTGSIGKDLYPSYVGPINHQFLVDAIATGRPLEILYLADSPRVLIKDPATGKYI